MLLHYLTSAARSIRAGRLYTLINLFGLVVGLAATLILLQLIRSELGYDNHHPDADRLVRITTTNPGAEAASALISPAIGPALASTRGDVVEMARLTPVDPLLSSGDVHIVPQRAFWADPAALSLFGFRWMHGSGDLTDPAHIVISATTARRLFGHTDVVDETILLNESETMRIAGVFYDTPARSHIHFDALASVALLESWFGRNLASIWDSPNYATYVRLPRGVTPAEFSSAISDFMRRNAPQDQERVTLAAQAVPDIHLHSTAIGELEPGGSVTVLWLLGAIAALILFIAGSNHVNLSTALMTRRTREVGLRKAMGATPGQLVLQYWLEAVSIAVLASALAASVAWSLLPRVAAWAGQDVSAVATSLTHLFLTGIVVGAALGTVSGFVPALRLARIHPDAAFRGRVAGAARRRSTQALVVLQFALALVVIVAALVVRHQMDFMASADLGYRTEGLVAMPGIRELANDFDGFRQRLLQNKDIVSVSHAWRPPGSSLLFTSEAAVPDGKATLYPFFADASYAETMGLLLKAGRMYAADRASDMESGVVLNETAVRALGFSAPEEAVSQSMTLDGRKVTVLGVVADFHQESLRTDIAPMVLMPVHWNYRTVLVRFATNDVSGLRRFLIDAWKPYEGNYPIHPRFVDDELGRLYVREAQLAQTLGAFSVLGVLVACLGLFGMAAVGTSQRRREMGIRKTLGATTGDVTLLVLREYAMLLLIALAVGLPVAVWAARYWLDSFAYHASLGPGIPLLAAMILILSALMAILSESIRAGRTNPVTALRSC